MSKQCKLLQYKKSIDSLTNAFTNSRNQPTHLRGFQDSLKNMLEKPSLDKDFDSFMKIIKPFVLGQQAFKNI
jgi:hypothetical protein